MLDTAGRVPTKMHWVEGLKFPPFSVVLLELSPCSQYRTNVFFKLVKSRRVRRTHRLYGRTEIHLLFEKGS